MLKLLLAATFCLLLTVATFDQRAAAVIGGVAQASGSGSSAHGCPKGQKYNRVKKMCEAKD